MQGRLKVFHDFTEIKSRCGGCACSFFIFDIFTYHYFFDRRYDFEDIIQ